MKKAFLTGLIILMPVALTVMVVFFVVDLFTDPFVNFFKDFLSKQHWIRSANLLTFVARLFSLISVCLFIFLLGFLTRLFFVRWMLGVANQWISKIPLIKPVYNTSKDIVNALFQQEGKAFKKPLMIPFPTDKSFSVGFETGEIPTCCSEKINKELVPVFIPTAPHPISGFMLMVPKEKTHLIDMTNEQAVKLTVSCGVILPEDFTK
ncbi:MAG: DUF502 domain-containing protein [Chlamydiota bacterium]|jgi:uncharacterized membrane protein